MDLGIFYDDSDTSMQQLIHFDTATEPGSLLATCFVPTGQSLCQHSSEEWDAQRSEITRLYVNEKLPLQVVIRTMESERGFCGTTKQYKDRIEKWGINVKNFKATEMKAAVRKRQQRKLDEDKETGIRIRGREVEPEKIEKFMKRNGISASSLYWPTGSAASTPSVISCYTPSNKGPPTPGGALEQPATALNNMPCPSNSNNALEAQPYQHYFVSTPQLSSIDEGGEGSFSYDFNDHGQLDMFGLKMTDYLTGDSDDEITTSGEAPGGLFTSQQEEWYSVFVEMLPILGLDRGFPDLDIGRNDDINAVNAGIPGSEDHGTCNFNIFTKDRTISLMKRGYYARVVPIKIPRSFEPLPSILLENPMNLLYFHHFISHTAQLLVTHNCSSNPFQGILTEMAFQDGDFMSLLLVYSAAHRARLLNHPEPALRMALWVKNVFPKFRYGLNHSESYVSYTDLATAIMLASLEIISPNTFGVTVPWQQHLSMARSMLRITGHPWICYQASPELILLHRWLVYHDVLGNLISGSAYSPSIRTLKPPSFAYYENNSTRNCLFGCTDHCIFTLALVADLTRESDIKRIDSNKNVRPDWKPDVETVVRANRLEVDLYAALEGKSFSCSGCYPFSSMSSMNSINSAYYCAGLIHLHRRVLGKSMDNSEVVILVAKIMKLSSLVKEGSYAQFHLLFPVFTAGCNTQDLIQRNLIMRVMQDLESFGMDQVRRARILMEKVWDTGKPFECLVSDEFVG